ncbi:MAG: hypothetical protein E7386_01845 [Ruminococcaceae bacterium]|nr:hypothetical protein [Oscillospiraceae bacterium]
MMRKFYKKKAGRRGAILVTVVFVLAFAVIFIAAAMMLTQATRKRVYTEAESNQARLTVTSVAESWYRAVQKCEFADEDLLDLCKAKSLIRVYASANADTVPGLENEGVKNDESYTTVYLYRVPNSEGATKADDYTYYADFTTHLDGQVENVRATLSYTTPTSGKNAAPFSTQIDLNNEFNQNNLEIIGKGKNDLDNIFLVRKGGKNKNASFSTYATMVYCDGEVAFKDDDFHCKDLVFLTGAKLANKNDSTMFKKHTVENLFFFGDSNEAISTGTATNFSPSGLNFYLCDRSIGDTSWVSGASVTYINADGTLKGGGKAFADDDVNNAFVKKVKKYASLNTSYKAGGTNSFPTTDEFISASSKLGITKTPPSTLTGKKFGNFLENNCYQKNGGKVVPGGTYLFTSDESDKGESHPGLGDKEPYIMVLSGSENYTFWFDGTFKLYNVVFIIDKPNPKKPALFLLAKNASVEWPSSDNGKVGGNGIFAVKGRNFDSAADAAKFIKDTLSSNLDGPNKFEDTESKGYSHRYDGKNEPCAMVIGMGKNTFKVCKNAILESFVGMFNDNYNESNQSKFLFQNNDHGVFYGRLMTDGYFDSDQGSISMPACPGSSNMDEPDPAMKKLVTNFKLKSMVYYYGIQSAG